MGNDDLQQLRDALAEARRIYDGAEATPDGETGQIAGVVNAVHAVVEFLHATDIDRRDLVPLLTLEAAFRDHHHGKRHALFDVARDADDKALNPGQRKTSQEIAYRATVAAAVKLCIRAGEKKADAERAVARAAGETRKTVSGWYREIGSGRISDAGAVHIYADTLAEAAKVHPDDPRRAAVQLITALPGLKADLKLN